VKHILAYDPIREPPIYGDGFTAGRDVGVANALAAITAERAPPGTTRQALGPRLRAPGVRRGVLLAVTKAVARSFSQ
jgi:hypothetical protein